MHGPFGSVYEAMWQTHLEKMTKSPAPFPQSPPSRPTHSHHHCPPSLCLRLHSCQCCHIHCCIPFSLPPLPLPFHPLSSLPACHICVRIHSRVPLSPPPLPSPFHSPSSLALLPPSRSPSSLSLSFLPRVLCFAFASVAPTPSPPLTLTLSFPPRVLRLHLHLRWRTLLPPLLACSCLHSQLRSRLALLRSPLPRVCVHHHPLCLVFTFTTPLVPHVRVHHPPSCLVLVFAVTTVPVFVFAFTIALAFVFTITLVFAFTIALVFGLDCPSCSG
jgi:hypothetical protein